MEINEGKWKSMRRNLRSQKKTEHSSFENGTGWPSTCIWVWVKVTLCLTPFTFKAADGFDVTTGDIYIYICIYIDMYIYIYIYPISPVNLQLFVDSPLLKADGFFQLGPRARPETVEWADETRPGLAMNWKGLS